MNQMQQNPLAALRDIHLPPEPGFWPPALGWWLVAFFLLAITSFSLIKWRQRQARLRPIKLALNELKKLNLESSDPRQRQLLLQELSALVRRFALIYFPQKKVADLCGQEWLDFICKNSHSMDNANTREALSPLVQGPYAPTCDTDLVVLGSVLGKWFKDLKGRRS
ncbi:DUF4381 domain-containing protein [bacterium]|nr:DUF4381 domain-containing protein [bacterium]